MGLKQAIKNTRLSTFQIHVNIQDGKRMGTHVLGTAFAIGDGRAVTAKHVVDAAEEVFKARKTQPVLGFPGPSADSQGIQIRAAFLSQSVGVIDVDAENDLALLETNSFDSYGGLSVLNLKPERPRAMRIRTERPEEGEPVACSGYPLNQPSLVTTVGYVASAWALGMTAEGMADRYLADLTVNPGNSGGPVYRTTDGKLIGVLVAGHLREIVGGSGLQDTGIADIIPAKAVAQLMNKNGVTVLT